MIDKATFLEKTQKNSGKGKKKKTTIVTNEIDELADAMDLLFGESRVRNKSFQERVKMKAEEQSLNPSYYKY